MAFKITQDCNNCGACEPECPNSAIAMGSDLYEINHSACTECVGFHGAPQCAAVCPVDACVTDPAHAEAEAALIAKLKVIYPAKQFAADMPSHFKK